MNSVAMRNVVRVNVIMPGIVLLTRGRVSECFSPGVCGGGGGEGL